MGRYTLLRRARPTSILAGLALISSAIVVPLVTASPAQASFSPANPVGQARGDFNHDGYADIAIGVPLESIAATFQGAVEVIYGGPQGLNAAGVLPDQLLVQNDPEGPEANDGFGLSLAVGDFNGDGFGDLAAGANGEDVGPGGNNEGSVTVFYGSAGGLVPGSSQYLVSPVPADNDQFGFFLAAGDFNKDGRDDLAVDVLNHEVSGQPGAGAVLIYPGSGTGLDTGGYVSVDQDAQTLDLAEPGDQFGSTMATGDVNGDGFADLAIGVLAEDIGGIVNAGAVHVFYGCSGTPTCNLVEFGTDQFLHQDVTDVKGTAQTGDFFGYSLAIGDFGRGPQGDLAIGIFGESISGVKGAGAVAVFYGSPSGLTTQGNQLWSEGNVGMKGKLQKGAGFGGVVAAGNLGKSGQADLAIGVPFEDVNGKADAGAVAVLYGTPTGLKSNGNEFLKQGSGPVPGKAQTLDGFGKTVVVADFGGSAFADLGAASRETVNGAANAGAVTVLYGSSQGLGHPSRTQVWTQDSPNVEDQAEAGDLFGGAFGQPGLAG